VCMSLRQKAALCVTPLLLRVGEPVKKPLALWSWTPWLEVVRPLSRGGFVLPSLSLYLVETHALPPPFPAFGRTYVYLWRRTLVDHRPRTTMPITVRNCNAPTQLMPFRARTARESFAPNA